jgi:hypothetical protein
VLESNGNNQLSMVGHDNGDGVYLDNVSACFTYGPCYYMEFETNNNFSVSGTVDYVDCNGVLQTYTANTQGTFYLCAIQSTGSVDIDLVDDSEYLCTDAGGGTWVPPYIESPTPTPSNPPTPTPSATSGLNFYEVFIYSFQGAPGNYSVLFQVEPQYNGLPIYIEADNGVDTFYGSGTSLATYTFNITGTSTTVRISGITTNVGEITSISNFAGINTNNSPASFTAATSEYGKLTSAYSIVERAAVTGNINQLSGLTVTTVNFQTASADTNSLGLYPGNFTGDINDLPNSIQYLTLQQSNTVYGNISNLPPNIKQLTIWGYNTLSGNTSGFPPFTGISTTLIEIEGYSQISGLMSDLPNAATIRINSRRPTIGYWTLSTMIWDNKMKWAPTGNTISGPLTLKSNHKEVIIGGSNTISGNINAVTNMSSGNKSLVILGYNTITGTLTAPTSGGFTQIGIVGNNTISGNISAIITNSINRIEFSQLGNYINPTSVTGPYNTSSIRMNTIVSSGNTITGLLSAFQTTTSIRTLRFGGQNSISGDIGTIYAGSTGCDSCGLNEFQVVTPNGTIDVNTLIGASANYLFPTQGLKINLNSTGLGLSQTEVNNLLYIGTQYHKNCTIGIGAGSGTDGQILVWTDFAGLYPGKARKFVKQYANLRATLLEAASSYRQEVADSVFPAEGHSHD